MKRVEIIFSEDSELVYISVNQTMVHAIKRKERLLQWDPHLGDTVTKRLIPEKYRRMGVTNLYRIELPGFWRMLYTLIDEQDKVVVLVSNILSHKEYDKVFGY